MTSKGESLKCGLSMALKTRLTKAAELNSKIKIANLETDPLLS